MVQSDLKVLPREENLMHFRQRHRLLLVRHPPNRCRILQRLINSQEQVDLTLTMRVAEVVCEVSLDTCDKFRSGCEKPFFLSELGMVRD